MERRMPRPLALCLLTLAWTVAVNAAGPMRCTTYEEKPLGRLQTLCDDGTRAVSIWSSTLSRWQTTITEGPWKTCTGSVNPWTQ
jgi:hypothetical protein